MLETRGRDTGSLKKASGEPNALKGARSVREEHSWLINTNRPTEGFARVVGGSSPLAPAKTPER